MLYKKISKVLIVFFIFIIINTIFATSLPAVLKTSVSFDNDFEAQNCDLKIGYYEDNTYFHINTLQSDFFLLDSFYINLNNLSNTVTNKLNINYKVICNQTTKFDLNKTYSNPFYKDNIGQIEVDSLENNSIGSLEIKDLEIQSKDIKDNNLTSNKIKTFNYPNNKIPVNYFTSSKIQDNSITHKDFYLDKYYNDEANDKFSYTHYPTYFKLKVYRTNGSVPNCTKNIEGRMIFATVNALKGTDSFWPERDDSGLLNYILDDQGIKSSLENVVANTTTTKTTIDSKSRPYLCSCAVYKKEDGSTTYGPNEFCYWSGLRGEYTLP